MYGRYVEHMGIGSGVSWLITQLAMIAVTVQCIAWGLTMAEMLLPPATFFDTSALIAMLRELGPSTLHAFFVTCLIAFCLGHRTAGEIEIESNKRKYGSDSSSLGSAVMLCLLISHFDFQLLPTVSR